MPRTLVTGVLFGFTALALARGAEPAPDTAATVDGEPIPLSELDALVKANLPGVPLTVQQMKSLRATLVNDLIDDLLLRQFLAKHGPKVDPAELDAQLKVFAEQLAKQNRTLADHLKQTGQSEARFRADWAAQMQLAAYVKQQVTDEQLKAFHAANRDYFDRVEVRLSHIVVRVGRAAPAADRAVAREKMQAVRAELAAGRIDFATAARKFSQCPTAKTGGDLGFILRRGLPEDEPLAKAAFALKVGQLSDVIETDYGFHVLLVTERKPGTPSEYEKCLFDVLETYTDDYRDELVKKLRKQAQIKITLP
jgi:peptidyl-prolyl cis-trans isomerase C